MTKYNNKYRIEPNRWPYWDYSAPGRYFLTVCTKNRKCILGWVIDGKMKLSGLGEIVKNEIVKIQQYNQRAILDEWIIMPNHIHLLIELGGYNYNNGFANVDDTVDVDVDVEKIHEFSLQSPATLQSPAIIWWQNPNYKPTIDEIKQYRKIRRAMIIPKIMGKYQMLTSKQINDLQGTPGNKNWQRDYHDHVIRDEASYVLIKKYIINNPKKWNDDMFNR